jgi:tetratricopeptide (TPR) repeat protein
MSVQKLIAEADKLLDKGKVPEALEKLKTAFNSEPMNQLVATKLANIFVESGDSAKAAKVYVGLANRLSEAGKAQVAIAVYKQALEINPDDIELKFRFAKECEGLGKIGDALVYAQQVLQYYIQRKKYFDASNIMPLLVRVHTKDESYKLAWVEVMQYSQAEQKLSHLLVALCGPPGLSSTEFPTGGEPTALSETLYEALKRLAAWFPRDAKIAYAIAWCAYRRDKKRDFFYYISESLRRDPDFCLSMLLFSRWLAEQQKLNESLFVYKFVKERLAADKSVDMLTLNRQVESFIEKNGWISFTDGMGEEALDAKSFVTAMKGQQENTKKEENSNQETQQENESDSAREERVELPAEIELSLSSGGDGAQDPVELQLAGGETRFIEAKTGNAADKKPAEKKTAAAKQEPKIEAPQAPVESVKKEAPKIIAAPQASIDSASDDNEESVEFTSILKINRDELNLTSPSEDSQNIPAELKSSEINTGVERKIQNELKSAFELKESSEAPTEEKITKSEKALFNPLEGLGDAEKIAAEKINSEKTQAFSPMEILQASNNALQQKIAEPETKTNISKEEEKSVPEEASPSTYIEGERTMMFSPVEAVDAGVASRRPMEVKRNLTVPTPPMPPVPQAPPPPPLPQAAIPSLEAKNEKSENASVVNEDATVIINLSKMSPPAALEIAPENVSLAPENAVDTEKTDGAGIVLPVSIQASVAVPSPALAPEPKPVLAPEEALVTAPAPESVAIKEKNLFQPIPQKEPEPILNIAPNDLVAEPKKSTEVVAKAEPVIESEVPRPQAITAIPETISAESVEEEVIDYGEDLLEGPTKMLERPPSRDATAHLIKELKEEIEEKKGSLDSNMLFRKAERYIAKRNYYLARKALRHAQALGADEKQVKEKLREIRKLELPDGLYSAISSDEKSPEGSESILEKLEEEFDLTSIEEPEGKSEINDLIESRIQEVLADVDAKTALDFAVALHEMGLFKGAENLLMGIVDRHPESAFDAYYLAAVSKSARKDYAGAASILKMLSADSAKSEQQKISVYYALGELFERMKQVGRSQSFFKKVAEIDSNYRNIREKLEE